MQGWTARLVVFARLVLVVTSLAGAWFGELQASAAAMDCCAKTNYDCAGVSAPDDCCQHMGHASHTTVATAQSSYHPATAIAGGCAAAFDRLVAITDRPPAPAFTRPHDPPHLHAHSLLI